MDSGSSYDPLDPPFVVLDPVTPTAPVVFASPHSGNVYPQRFVDAARLDAISLRSSEDAFIDDLFTHAPTLGMPLIKARFPRAYVDVNREPWELDPGMFSDHLPDYVNRTSPRASAGLGTIARIVANGAEIYADKISFAEAKHRIETLYIPYHARLAALVQDAHRGWCASLLVDCHSMPSLAGPLERNAGRRRVDFVLGDCHGRSCTPEITDLVERTLIDLGYTVARNDPYAGGFTTRHYGRPQDDRHALQIEVNRGLYMDERAMMPRAYFATLTSHVSRLMTELREYMRARCAAPA